METEVALSDKMHQMAAISLEKSELEIWFIQKLKS